MAASWAVVSTVALSLSSPAQAAAPTDLAGLRRQLVSIVRGSDGVVGLAVEHLPSGQRLHWKGGEQFPTHSVYKLPIVMTVLAGVESGRWRLEQAVEITADDVAPFLPVADKRWERTPRQATIAELMEAAIADSDNVSSDKLLALAGGPPAVVRWLRQSGLPGIDVRSSVAEMRRQKRHDLNTATPLAVVRLLASLHFGRVLSPASRKLLLAIMERTRTGPSRIRAGFPPGTVVAHKTGGGGNGSNDVGIVTLPDGRGHLLLAVFIKQGRGPAPGRDNTIAAIARAAGAYRWPSP